MEQQGTKVCSRCKKELTLKCFYKFKNHKDGLRSECKECQKGDYNKNLKKHREYEKQYRENNSERYKKHRENNKEKHLEYMKKYYSENKQKFKQYLEENKEKIALKNKRYIENNREKINAINRKRKRLFYRLKHTLTDKDWEEIQASFNNECAYCGQAKKLEHDHFIPISKGGEYTKNNIIPCCKSCNCSKGNKDFFEWYPQFEFYSAEREKNISKSLVGGNKIDE